MRLPRQRNTLQPTVPADNPSDTKCAVSGLHLRSNRIIAFNKHARAAYAIIYSPPTT